MEDSIYHRVPIEALLNTHARCLLSPQDSDMPRKGEYLHFRKAPQQILMQFYHSLASSHPIPATFPAYIEGAKNMDTHVKKGKNWIIIVIYINIY